MFFVIELTHRWQDFDHLIFVEVPLQGWFILQFFSTFPMVSMNRALSPVGSAWASGCMCGLPVILLLHGLVCIMIHSGVYASRCQCHP